VSTRALLLVVCAAVLHAGWNALTKRGRDPLAFLFCAGALGAMFFLPGALYLLWAGGLPLAALPFVVGTVLAHAVYFFALGRAYGQGDLSVVYPVARGTGVALVAVLGLAILDERLSWLGAAGVALVVLGIFSLHHRPGAARALLAPGSGWALFTGVTIAAYSLVDKAGVARLHPLAYIGLMEVGACLLLMPAMLARRAALAREWRTNWRTITAAAVMSPAAYLLVLFAFQISKAAYVVASREISIVFSALIGSLLLGEGALGRRLGGALVVAAGVACVALAR
jgi:drug/metabolite transporter (DMT)-like permease